MSLFIFIAGQQQRLSLPERHKHKADPALLPGIVLIAIATPVLLCYLVIRVSRSGAAARVANPRDRPRRVGVAAAAGRTAHVQGKRERPDARFWSTMALRLGTPTPLPHALRRHRIDGGRVRGNGGVRAVRRTDAGHQPELLRWPLATRQSSSSTAAKQRSSSGATYVDLHLGCVSLAALTLALSIVLCLTLGPPIARRVAHSGRMMTMKCSRNRARTLALLQRGHLPVRPARVRARDPFCSARLRCAAGKPPSGDAVELGPRGENR